MVARPSAQLDGIPGFGVTMAQDLIAEFNRAVAVGLVHGPRAGLDLLDTLQQDKRVAKHHRLLAAPAHLLELVGEPAEAAKACARAARLSTSTPERRYLATQAKRLSSGVEPMPL